MKKTMEFLCCFTILYSLHYHVQSLEFMDAFSDMSPVNKSHSYRIITQLPLKNYQFRYDTISGRKQLGIIGPEIKHILPDSLHFYKKRNVIDFKLSHDGSRKRKKVILNNYYVVDKDNLFMHNIAATQFVMQRVDDKEEEIIIIQKELVNKDKEIKQIKQILEKEATVDLIEKRKTAEAEERKEKYELEQFQVKGSEERKTLLLKQDIDQRFEKEKHNLSLERIEKEDRARKSQNKELVKLQETSQLNIEMKRRETEAELMQSKINAERENALLEFNSTLEKAKIDAESRIKQQRMNEDIEMRQLQERNKADHEKLIRAIQTTFDNIGNGFMTLFSDKEKLFRLVGTETVRRNSNLIYIVATGSIIALAAGIYVMREAVRIIGQVIEQHLGRPSLVRETSRTTGVWGFLKSIFKRVDNKNKFADVILPKDLQQRVLELAKSTLNARRHGAPYRHLLLFGPPGTGKTMVARRLAMCSGMEYALMSGGDVGPLGSDAVTELHSIFRWARSSPRGVLLFIDEAESFLGCRGKSGMSEAMRNALNALLYQTGQQSYNFMLVIATNRPEDLDPAVTDRIDETLEFQIPQKEERMSLLNLYYTKYILHAHSNLQKSYVSKAAVAVLDTVIKKNTTKSSITASSVTGAHLKEACSKTQGMSGREISKLMLYLQNVVYGQDEKILTPALLARVVQDKVKEHERKIMLKHSGK